MKVLLFLLISLVAGNRRDKEYEEDEKDKKDQNLFCLMPPDPGFCRAILRRWAWNPVEERCERFEYGGCGGNRNNFKTQKECLYECWNKFVPKDQRKKPIRKVKDQGKGNKTTHPNS
ncbi:Kunitz/Bovine pancreatic trypsin inhibitor domain protein [Necator americanus]|uniref:Kunitz/Bovine pancreatic trypsin inhibitor domain protein n=1 Tax=Necator americanus TaxID=51031 RepID=W2SVX3_NECAM|nr:Kunitz/Bovine pancreatic trypsin inhibitor domain protein [Necator americanus]ETN73755.1 Kunitz/Bovine pancreatic trypsin inhibitor domain protein [Necator americanus]